MKKNVSNERDNERLIKQQAERIEELREENRTLEGKLEEYRKREGEIAETLNFARKKGEEYLSLVRVKYALECDRIQRFREKLEKFRNKDELVRAYETSFKALREWQNDLENAMANGFGTAMEDYKEEKERLQDEPKLNYGAIVERETSEMFAGDKLTDAELCDLLDQI